MKKINCNDWAPRNQVPDDWAAPIPITNPLMLIVTRNYLYYSFHTYSAGGVACVYHNITYLKWASYE
jgi:hypothetical protein